MAGRTAPLPALTGTVVETASLGLPQLPGTSDQNSITSLLAGSHTIKVWYADPQHIRLAVPMHAERDGRDPQRPRGLGLAEQARTR